MNHQVVGIAFALAVVLAAVDGPVASDLTQLIRLTLPGWNEEVQTGGVRVWRNSSHDALYLALPDQSLGLLALPDETARRQRARELAQRQGGGLIEVGTSNQESGTAVSLVYKRLRLPAYIYTGILLLPIRGGSVVWTITAAEHGTTGVREATITAELFRARKLTSEEYKRSWAQDPYDPTYHGVDRSVLRFMSDHQRYDERFPEHPLSIVRRVLDALPGSIQVAR